MKILFFTSLFVVIASLSGVSQNSSFPITNYTTKEYGRDLHPSNRAIIQDHRGVIYAANGFRLLEYDGHTWNSYPINKVAQILSLAIDKQGILYAGSQNEFGYFSPDHRGELKYTSISDSLQITDMDFTNIWRVHSFSDGIVFQSEEKIFIYSKGKTEIINPLTSFHTSFIVNDNLYVRQRGSGLMRFANNSLVKVRGGEIFDTTGVFLMLPFGKGTRKILIGTQEKGFWIYEPENTVTPFKPFKIPDPDLLNEAKITGGVLTGNGQFAVSTMLNGLIIIDTTGTTMAVINRKSGLSDNDIKQVITDQSQNLWLALNNGISTIELSSPLSVFNEKSGIPGNINSLSRYKNQLYAGTSRGLFVQKPYNESEAQFVPLPGLPFQIWSVIEADGRLLAGTDAGLYQLSGNELVKISNEESVILYYAPELRLLFSGGPKGLSAYKNEGSFKKFSPLDDVKEDIIGIAQEKGANPDTSVFWIGTRNNGVMRLKILKSQVFSTDYYSSSDGLPGGPVTPFTSDSKIVFGTIEGLHDFTSENKVKESLPDSLKNNKDFLRGYFSGVSVTNDSTKNPVSLLTENSGKIWICSDNKVGYFDKMKNNIFINQPFLGIDVGKINTIFPEKDGVCWFGTTEGLIRYDGNISKKYNSDYLSIIRKVTLINNDSVLFMGSNYESDSILKTKTKRPEYLNPVLQYGNNSIRIEFTAPFYEYSDKMFYSYQIEGQNLKWTSWKQENYQEYTNLREGNYTFRVKARNVYGTESTITQYSFTILPPWYRSVVAYVIYMFSSVMFVWLTVRLYSYRLKRENIRLEGIVTERTIEIVRQKNEIENKNEVLEYQKKEIEDSIRYASRIQTAVIPSEEDCLRLLPECFVFFRPLNIVSGDFYWIGHVENKIVFTAADCTGHGVPGAIMSMLGVAFLNEIVTKDQICEPDAILNNLRNKIIHALQQHGVTGESRDGMDIAIIAFDEQERIIQYAGAYNPLIMIRNGEVLETKADKMPIGFYENMRPFTKHEFRIEKGDVFYMSSDGYEDQFGGPDGKKFMAKKFKQLLLEIHKLPMKSQKEIIEKRFTDWKGDLKQIDDIVVTGFSIK